MRYNRERAARINCVYISQRSAPAFSATASTPRCNRETPDDYTRPLQLLARALEFTDPLSGALRRFESERKLS